MDLLAGASNFPQHGTNALAQNSDSRLQRSVCIGTTDYQTTLGTRRSLANGLRVLAGQRWDLLRCSGLAFCEGKQYCGRHRPKAQTGRHLHIRDVDERRRPLMRMSAALNVLVLYRLF